jgi:prepilin-type N-terminal cleavage/methylation domain-containing protein
MTQRVFKPNPAGFTLAEVLIALALLGIVAAFAIPKVLETTGKQEAKAKLQETVGILEGLYNEDRLSGLYDAYFFQVAPNTNNISMYNAMQNRLNVLKKSATTVFADTTHPCYFRGYEGSPSASNYGQIVLPNGVLVTGLAGTNATYSDNTINGIKTYTLISSANESICIDINGPGNGADSLGQDIFIGNFNITGDFDRAGGSLFTPRLGNRSFYWGSKSQPIYTQSGAALSAPYDAPEYRVGYYLD